MIVTNISAGLGNQLFQYAFGRVLTSRHNVTLKTDLYWFTHEQNTSHRKYGLHHFDIKAQEATWQELDEYIFADTRWHRYSHPYYKRIRIQEREYKYDSNVWKFPKHTFVTGYWQSWQYYADYHSIIRNEFQVLTPPSDKVLRLLGHIDQRNNSVAIHIRRGDYVTNSTFNTLTPDYYERAILYLQERFSDIDWYIFSDDLPWVIQNISLPQHAVLIEGLSDIDDFRLMNSTQHTIIANSTFSWWAAWLKMPDKSITVAPKQLFNSAVLYSADDLLPPHFIRL